MGLAAELGVPLNQVGVKDAEEAIKGGGLCPEGVHHAVLEGCRSVDANSGSKGRELTFKVIAGPGKDSVIEETVWLPSEGQDEAKKKKTQNRLTIYMHRLGLLKAVTGKDGKEVFAEVEGVHDFTDVLGKTCFIEVKHEEEHWKDKKSGADKKMMKAKLTFEGVLKPDDKKCVGVTTGTAPPPTSIGSKPGGGKPDDYSDL